ncbi:MULTISPECIES: 5'/3'-nucleotidase SurE [Ochrobactrum]|jgi:5'-nucleotidase|uniref:5'-nucleotidase SurE n=1 Tax=Ochrobactrum quorumnocens TaxID=271865 RepID=A0A5N1JYU2_9HYPH|nr:MULTISPECIES: 5'/3'-nucleotidase SurE [Brucella/Ochrobactrum group]KAA9368378.1 5'/3'-nucleotidase SurE [[Ochrobactrum] quorumnocens]MBD7991714.1 5'/3'-nucleotidase SurE [Ochrobactrum gallinarum]MDH7792595.1 5'-nucleotidase [Ochrobactrum sp. AN78]
MRILVANDDGIDAPGLDRLVKAALSLSDDVWVVAPDGKRTAAGASITIGRPLTMVEHTERRYACSGTPADCVVTAMTWLFDGQKKPDLVLSGVNDGRNVAEDLAYSGTLGIAREATFWGIPAIGFSRVKQAAEAESDIAWLAGFIRRVFAQREAIFLEGHWLSVNLPEVLPAAIVQPRIGRDKIGTRAEILSKKGQRTEIIIPRGRAHAAEPGDDNDLIDRGNVCVSRLNWFGETALDAQSLAVIGRN